MTFFSSLTFHARLRLLFVSALVSLLLPLSISAASFGSFVTQYSLPSGVSPVGIAVGQSGALYAADSSTVYSFASSSATPTTVAPTTPVVSLSWIAAQPGSDLLLVADNGQGRFLYINGTTGGSPYGDLIHYASPQSCGFLDGNRVALLDQTGAANALSAEVIVLSVGQTVGFTFIANWQSTLMGFTTDYADGWIVFSTEEGVVIYSSRGFVVNTFYATSDNSIAYVQAAVASDALGHLFFKQSTVSAATNVEFIAVTTATDILQANAQLGVVNGLSAAPLAKSLNNAGNPIADFAVDAAGQLYGLNGAVVQVLTGLTAGMTIPAPLVITTPGYFLYEIVVDGNNPSVPLTYPTDVAFDSAGNRYIVDLANVRVVEQTAAGAFVRSITGDFTGPEEVRTSGDFLFISDPVLNGGTGKLYVFQSFVPYATISEDDMGNLLSNNNFFSFDIDANGKVVIALAIVDSTSNTATIRISVLSPAGMAVSGASFDIPGQVSGGNGVPVGEIVGDVVVDRVSEIAYIAYLTGSVVGYSMTGAAQGSTIVSFTTWGSGNPFTLPYGVFLDTAGQLYVADFAQGVIVLNANTGAYIDNFQGYYNSTSADFATNSVTIEPSTGHVFMTDDKIGRVVVLQGFFAPIPSSSSSSTAAIPPTSAPGASSSASVASSSAPVASSTPAASSAAPVSSTAAALASSSAPIASSAPPSASSSAPSSIASSSSAGGGGHIVGDPQFVGFRGQSFQVHGIHGHVYSLISEPTLQVNALFVFLNGGHCPTVSGRPSENCWSHPGSYIGDISFQHRSQADGTIHRVLITAGDAQTGLGEIEVDGQEMASETMSVEAGNVTVERLTAFEVRVSTPHFQFELINSDGFLNELVRPLVSLRELAPHGLLGQTWQLRKVIVDGMVEDYSILDSDMFGSDSVYDRFSFTSLSISE